MNSKRPTNALLERASIESIFTSLPSIHTARDPLTFSKLNRFYWRGLKTRGPLETGKDPALFFSNRGSTGPRSCLYLTPPCRHRGHIGDLLSGVCANPPTQINRHQHREGPQPHKSLDTVEKTSPACTPKENRQPTTQQGV